MKAENRTVNDLLLNNIRVVHITTVDISLRYLLLNQMAHIQSEGFSTTGISTPGDHVPSIEEAGIRHIPVRISRRLFSPFSDLRSLVQLVLVLRREKFDIVHVHTPKASFLGQIAARLVGTPVIIRTLHGFYFQDGTRPIARKIMILLEKAAAGATDMILSQNSEDLDTALREKICSPERIRLLGNGIDLEYFHPEAVDPLQRKKLQEEFGLNPKQPVVGFVGRLVAEKGIPEFLEAAGLVQEQIPGVQFLIVGDSDQNKKDRITPVIARKFDVEEICRFVGFQEQMSAVYSLMDIFVLPSHREGFPRAAMEASAMGVPVIASDIRGCREVVRDRENGILVPVKDSGALAEAILELLRDPERSLEMGSYGRSVARERFDEKVVFEIVLAVYRELLDEKDLI